jgi:inhibitor of KinA sporulation pathway (predicted exonuclease)
VKTKAAIVSIDIETTGLDSTIHGCIEIGAVHRDADGGLRTFRVLIKRPMLWDWYCLGLHEKLIAEIAKAEVKTVGYHLLSTMKDVTLVLSNENELRTYWDFWCPKDFIVTGKNFGAFDARFLDKFGMRLPRRTLDVGNMYYRPGSDVKLPDLDQCIKRSGLKFKGTRHTAVDDAVITLQLTEKWLARRGERVE